MQHPTFSCCYHAAKNSLAEHDPRKIIPFPTLQCFVSVSAPAKQVFAFFQWRFESNPLI